ncbi:TetR/AcrR family transcriptional regulator [Faecalibaculum rodentium]|uniref:TetR/AcrR family transcriptional regulator n=1 Tax=Faecalibaculum rodentium TaxID=1702221 RepID=UPI00255AF5E0|nr:TetR/AcrR family transcriptional regulator [Faecalibaculum rodentium]
MTRQRKTSEFLRTCIFEGLMLLLDQKKYEDITISELAEKAGVSRMTYYRTYENKEDVVIQFLRTRTDSLLRQFDEGNYNNRYEWYRDIFEEILEQKDVTYKILKTPQLCAVALEHFNNFAKVLLPRVYKIEGDSTVMHNRIIYQTGGFVFLMSHWVLDGCKQSPDEMARLLDSYIHNEKK